MQEIISPNTPSVPKHCVPRKENGSQNILNRLPWHIAVLVRAVILWAEFYRAAHISAVEIRNLPHCIETRRRKIRSLPLARTEGISLVPDRSGLCIWKPSCSEYIRQVMAERPWASLFDLSLCLQGWQEAIESLRDHIRDSGKVQKGIEMSDSPNP